MGSGPNTEAYTSATASVRAAMRSARLPELARKRLLYLPEKAAPSLSSRRLELRTMIGRPSSSSSTVAKPRSISGGKKEFLKSWTTLA